MQTTSLAGAAIASNLFSTGILLLLTAVIIGVGIHALDLLKVRCAAGERLYLAFAAGAGVAGYAIFLLAAAQLLYPTAIYITLVLLLIPAYLGWRTFAMPDLPGAIPFPKKPVEKAAAAGLAMLLAAAFILTLTPEIGKDALVYHLAAPKQYLQQHGFYFIPGNVFSNLPFLTEMLYTLALFLQGDVLAKGINFMALPVILLGMNQLARNRLAISHPTLVMLIFTSLPTIFELAHVAYTDLYIALFALSGVHCFLRWQEEKELPWIILAGLFTGLAVSTKYSAAIIPFIAMFGILWEYRAATDPKPLFRDGSAYLLAAIIFGFPFYAKNYLLTGNPVYPFMFQLFGGKGLDPELSRLFAGLYKYMGMGRSWLDYLLLPWNLSFNAEMNSRRFDGLIGPVFLLLLPLLFAIRAKEKQLLTIIGYCGVSFLFWASSSQDIRYLTPILPLLTLLIGVIISHFERRRAVMIYTWVVITCCILFNAYQIAEEVIRINPLPVVAGMEDKKSFLKRSLSTFTMYDFVNNNLPSGAMIFLVNMKNYTYLCDRKCYSDTMFESHTLQRILNDSATAAEVRDRVKGMGFSHLMYDAKYVTEGKSLLTADKINLFNEFKDRYLTLITSDNGFRLYKIAQDSHLTPL